MIALKTLNDMLEATPTLLSFVDVPEPLSNAYMVKAILDRCGDVAPYYQDENKFIVYGALWFATHGFLFDHAINILQSEYSPIENYNRIEDLEETRTKELDTTNTETHTGTDTKELTIERDIEEGGTTGTSETIDQTIAESGTTETATDISAETGIAGFDSADYEKADSRTEDNTETITHGKSVDTDASNSTTITHGRTESYDDSTTEEFTHGHVKTTTDTGTVEDTITNTNHIHGNIGVTTNQDMIMQEIDMMKKFAIYDLIASAFETDNFICVYNDYFGG